MQARPMPRSTRRLRPELVLVALLATLAVIVAGTLVARPGHAFPGTVGTAELRVDEAPPPTKATFEGADGAAAREAGPAPASDALGDDAARALPLEDSPRMVDGALIVRTASLELEVSDVAAALLDARAGIRALGGYLAGSDEYDQGDRRWASVVYRVPVARFDHAIDGLRARSDQVVRETTQSQEVTATVVDLDARIANLEASEAALVEIMDRSGRIEDVLAVQLRLEGVRGQIEQLEAQRDHLADQAALSTISVTWSTPVAAVTAAQEMWSVADEVDEALAQTVEALQGAASLGIWFGVVVLPLMGLPLLVAVLVLVMLRRRAAARGDGPHTTLPAATE